MSNSTNIRVHLPHMHIMQNVSLQNVDAAYAWAIPAMAMNLQYVGLEILLMTASGSWSGTYGFSEC